MTHNSDQNQPLSLEGQVDEARVRRALGLQGPVTQHQQRPEQARHRHRFVSDGAVPVVMLNQGEGGGLKERLTVAESALEHERAQHGATKRALFDAQASLQALQTRLAHAELAHNEAIAAERRARQTAEEALTALQNAPPPEPERPTKTVRAKLPRVPRVAREQKPVRWWTPSYRAKQS